MEAPFFSEDPEVPLSPISSAYDLQAEVYSLAGVGGFSEFFNDSGLSDFPGLLYNSKYSVNSAIPNDSGLSDDQKIFNDLKTFNDLGLPGYPGLLYNSKYSVNSAIPNDSGLSDDQKIFNDLKTFNDLGLPGYPGLLYNSKYSVNSAIPNDSGLSFNPGLSSESENSKSNGSAITVFSTPSNDSRDSNELGFPIGSTLFYGSEKFEDSVKLGHLVDLSFQAKTAGINEDHGLFPAEKLHKDFSLTTSSSFGGSKVRMDKFSDDFNDNQIFISPDQPDHNTRVLCHPGPECSDHGCNGRHSGSCSNLPHRQSERGNASDKHSNSNWDVWPPTSKNRDSHNSYSYEENVNIKEKSLCSPSLIADVRNLDSKPGSIYGYRCPTLKFRTSYKQSSLPNLFTSADAVLGNLPQESVSGPRNDDTKPSAMEETAVSCDLRLINPSSPKLEPSCKQTKVQDSSPLSNSCSPWSSDDDTDLEDDESDREGHTAKTEISTKSNASTTENQAPGFDTHPFFFKLKYELIDSIMLEFWEYFNRREETIRIEKGIIQNTHIRKCNGSRKSSTAEQNTTPTSKTDSPTTTSPELGLETHKDEGRSKMRKRMGKGDDSDNEGKKERNPKRPRNLSTRSRILDDAKKFACPYRKHDAKKYCIQNWRSCALTPLDSVARVKGHLYRHHRIFQCQRCKRLFSDQQEVNDHLKQAEACELSKDVQDDGITNEIMEKLRSKKKTHRSQSEEDRWKEMYRTIFSTDVIPDPYFEEVQEDFMQSLNAQQLTDYEEYCRQELPRIVKAELEETINSLEKQLKHKLLEIICNAQDRVFASYRSSSIPLGTNDGSEASLYSGSYEPVLPTSPSQMVAMGCQFTSNESGETYSTQEPRFFQPLPSQINLDSRLDVAALDIEATCPEYNDQLNSVHNAITDIPPLLTTNYITKTPASNLEDLPCLPVNRGETSEAESKAANSPLGYGIDKGENTTDYFDSSLLQNGMDINFSNMDFSNLDMSYFDNVEPLILEDL
ncbi:f8c9ece0-bf87-47e0-874a-78644042707a [Sclerotinia trifoliorum]|uniref:F8c9ece0-bf87-47e0-874a-78644042707a n=1 Tax=Sclerotinia trifoliorum TaxID=28548 RepID=A0A8H2ZMM3_9HELO|nr:f8c9ece0-bf87-47e0-874a-78644042707a [Sclerotinia trifoliorum]